jgi:hypothetical protein
MDDPIARIVWIIFFTSVHFGVNLALAYFIEKRFGNFWIWFSLLILLPVIGQIFCLYYFFVYIPKQRRGFQKVIGDPDLQVRAALLSP